MRALPREASQANTICSRSVKVKQQLFGQTNRQIEIEYREESFRVDCSARIHTKSHKYGHLPSGQSFDNDWLELQNIQGGKNETSNQN